MNTVAYEGSVLRETLNPTPECLELLEAYREQQLGSPTNEMEFSTEARPPLFFNPLHEHTIHDLPYLQRKFLGLQADGHHDLAEAVDREMLMLYFDTLDLCPAMGPPVCFVRTTFGVITHVGADHHASQFALRYGSVRCAQCCKQLRWDPTHNTNVQKLTFYVLPCGHAVRFCGDCRHEAHCTMCSTSGKARHRSVLQADDPMVGIHVKCVNDPCKACA